ncbi:MAG: CDP-glucose 4,6-dehydratase [Gammaproteobacteria bacterium]|nr:CDP-glucose 4,6-dehydratase [Gammaproteobacteria bacterium]MBU1602895.1 CDP-glucose 4,6-dehydratase [Gammaproteobacteria bacterium]MBU2432567.1 CDP-glucose 4,6-dehydratase [Gammaproteobacteria bacterium]MBU2448890.1 CDP-glucose 4,6-dehydratase [Gammaproteobacteria bacterium]
MVDRQFWHGRRVFLTGHTGFKGSWLSLWLDKLGAELSGFALAPPTSPALYDVARVGECISSTIGDIRDAAQLADAMHGAAPEILFHLAAQPLVGEGYRDPVGTYATNVMGTVNVLEAARFLPSLRAIVIVTTDKCYANHETGRAFKESDPLGGHDPYSSSKACTELVGHAYRQSFLNQNGIRLATARAGNVIGGGDWAVNRLLPDLLRAFARGETAQLRHPLAIRPWQHVLDPLCGYLMLAERLCAGSEAERAWNFGPAPADCVTTGELATRLATAWGPQASWSPDTAADFPHEATLLSLDACGAKNLLKWRPEWPLTVAIEQTAKWHQAWLAGDDMQAFCRRQITEYAK